MKTCSLYGFISALAGAFLTLAIYFLGLHSDPAKLTTAGWVGGIFGLAIAVTCVALGVKARRAEVPQSEHFGYGSALWAGVLVSAVSSVLSSIFSYAYYAFINPGLNELLLQNASTKLEASGVSGDRLEKIEAFNKWMMKPGVEAVTVLIYLFIIGVIISLIVAAILKRPEPETPPLV